MKYLKLLAVFSLLFVLSSCSSTKKKDKDSTRVPAETNPIFNRH